MRNTLCALALVAAALPAGAADGPTIRIGATIFADHTWQETPKTVDADGNKVNASSFNVGRAYLNLTGSLSPRLSFRVTSDIAREGGSGSSLSGSQVLRLKYAYGQLNLDEWTTKGSFVRFGMQQTPYLDYVDSIYRYRFQGTSFVEREGYLSSADSGIAMRYVFPANRGDVMAGVYNGEGYSKSEANDKKAVQVRATLRPLPSSALWKGLRTTLFVDADRYVGDSARERVVANVAYEHARFNAGVDLLSTKDRTSSTKPELEGRGWAAFVTPKLGKGWELLLRHDHNRPDRDASLVRKRTITGVAYWLPDLDKVTASVILDRDSLAVTGKPDETRYGLKMLLVF
jgi:hypothetical protein